MISKQTTSLIFNMHVKPIPGQRYAGYIYDEANASKKKQSLPLHVLIFWCLTNCIGLVLMSFNMQYVPMTVIQIK